MLASIHPLGERARNSRYWLTLTAYAVGSVAGGALAGAGAGLVGSLLPVPVIVLVAACAVAAWLEVRGRGWPTVRRQVDEEWVTRYRGWVYGLGFGVQLGLGVVTIVTSPAVYAMVIAAVMS